MTERVREAEEAGAMRADETYGPRYALLAWGYRVLPHLPGCRQPESVRRTAPDFAPGVAAWICDSCKVSLKVKWPLERVMPDVKGV